MLGQLRSVEIQARRLPRAGYLEGNHRPRANDLVLASGSRHQVVQRRLVGVWIIDCEAKTVEQSCFTAFPHSLM